MTTIIERPYKVYAGEQEYVESEPWKGELTRTRISWSYSRSFRTEEDAAAYAQRLSGYYEFVKIEGKENN